MTEKENNRKYYPCQTQLCQYLEGKPNKQGHHQVFYRAPYQDDDPGRLSQRLLVPSRRPISSGKSKLASRHCNSFIKLPLGCRQGKVSTTQKLLQGPSGFP